MDPTPNRGGPDAALLAQIEGIKQRLDEIENPSGTQRAQAVKKLQDAVAAQQQLLTAQAAQLAFLQTQNVFDSRATLLPWSGSNSGVTWFPYQADYNAAVTVTTGASGVLVISTSALMSGGGATSAVIAVEIAGVSGPTAPAPGMLMVGGTTSLTSSSTFRVQLAGNTTYTILTRHGANGTGSGSCIWGYQALSVTRSA
ncbi:hypothetical protein MRBLWO14_000995 [Microbacterium sp. LWO14-1.2]|uniref:hypothetical protein n=1 Tax=Microbacterium sp. LWO14-1.2 TaxID=3135263 RepID=UPI003139D43F